MSLYRYRDFHYIGPHLDQGAAPTLFYFALSASESLLIDPYFGPIPWIPPDWRVFSIDLPLHTGEYESSKVAPRRYAEAILKGEDPLFDFIEKTAAAINEMMDAKIIAPHQTLFAGLSRGAWIAGQLLLKVKKIKGAHFFSPLVFFSEMEEATAKERHLFLPFDLGDWLGSHTLRISIGNKDGRVFTDKVVAFALHLISLHRSPPPIELKIFQSVGWQGHGTPPSEFAEGAKWLIETMGNTL